MIFTIIVLGVILLLGLGYFKLNQNKNYWKKRGFPEIKRRDGTVGGFYKMFTRKKNMVDFDVDVYNDLNGPFGGVVDFGIPSLMVKDPELLKHILVKDFDHFVDRRKVQLDSEPILNLMLTSLEGQEWKNIRSVISPTFTTGKIRRMFENFNSCGAQLVEFIKSKPVGSPNSRDVVIKEAISRYLVDVIGATAFGMDTNSLKDPNSIFYKMAKRTSEFSMMKLVKILIMMALPFLSKLGFRFTDSTSFDFFEGILKKALKNRESENSTEKREDFLQLLIEARKGELNTDESELEAFEKDALLSKDGETSTKGKVNLTDDLITAQSVLFFVAGLDTTGGVLSFAAYILAIHQDIQEKLYKEVNKVMKDKNGDVDYEGICHMEYMDKFISEILRQYPPGTRIERRCTKAYTIPGTDKVLEKDVIVGVSVLGMHRDPTLYPDPEKFDPERFTPEAKAARNPYTYLPFGHGPRNCVGMRFALMEAKVAIAYMVYNFLIEPCEKTPVPIMVDPNFGARPPIDLELRFKERMTPRAEE